MVKPSSPSPRPSPDKRPEPQPQGTLRRHATGVEFLAGRDGGGPAHGGGELQEPLVAERLAAVGLLRLADLVELLEDPQGRRQRVGSPPAGPPSAPAPRRTPPVPGCRRRRPSRPTRRTWNRGTGHRGLRLDRRPGHRRGQPLLAGRLRGVSAAGRSRIVRSIDLGDRDDPAEPLDLLAEFVAERRDRRVLAPAVTVGRDDLADPGSGDVQGVGDVGLAGPVARAVATPTPSPRAGRSRMRHSASFFGILTPTTRCSSSSRRGRPRRLVRCGLVLGAAPPRRSGNRPRSWLDEVDDLPPGLVADPTHQVDVADRDTPAGCGRSGCRPAPGRCGHGCSGPGRRRASSGRPAPAMTRRSTSSPPGVVIVRCSASWKTCCQAHRISSALSNRCAGSRCKRLAEEPDQALPDARVELLGVDRPARRRSAPGRTCRRPTGAARPAPSVIS